MKSPRAPRLGLAGREEPVPRAMVVALCGSIGVHLLMLASRLGNMAWSGAAPVEPKPLRVVYERQALGPEAQVLRRVIDQRIEHPASKPSAVMAKPQIRVPEHPPTALPGLQPGAGTEDALTRQLPGGGSGFGAGSGALGAGQSLPDFMLGGFSTSPVIDLTNLVAAAKGDPVLLSYFSVIREQIQKTANANTWMTGKAPGQGIVFLSFVLARDGQVRSAAVLGDRSVSSKPLQDIALTIVKSAGPFPPFPPSLSETFKTVVVPLEFLLGS